ncbi:MAG: HAD family phosphatase [Clostridia bacterium]|nr:HAD family phosphatase [Clostridia bacterium]
MYKLVAIDLDGTMLNSYGEVTENTKRVIKETMMKGTEIIIASGRTIDSIKAIASDIGSKRYMIAGNGSIIYDIQNDKIIYEKYIPKMKALDIIKICQDNSIMFNIYTNKTIITENLRYNVLYYYKENLKKEQEKKTSITIVEDIYDYVKNMQDEKVMKIMICDETRSVFNAILRKMEDIEDIEILDVSHMSRKIIKNGSEDVSIEYFYTEISMKDVDKWYALEFLIDKLNILKEEIMAIGDNINDKKMIQNAGMGVVMKGSTPKVEEVADYITDDNNHEGVANAIEKFIE